MYMYVETYFTFLSVIVSWWYYFSIVFNTVTQTQTMSGSGYFCMPILNQVIGKKISRFLFWLAFESWTPSICTKIRLGGTILSAHTSLYSYHMSWWYEVFVLRRRWRLAPLLDYELQCNGFECAVGDSVNLVWRPQTLPRPASEAVNPAFSAYSTLIDIAMYIFYLIWDDILLQEHHEEDFFLYIAYSDESVYGA